MTTQDELDYFVEQLLRGIAPENATLECGGCDRTPIVQAVLTSPVFPVARGLVRYLQRVELTQALQRAQRPTRPVAEYQPGDFFFGDFYENNRPVIIRKYVKDYSPELAKWGTAYFTEKVGNAPVEVTVNRSKGFVYDQEPARFSKTMPMREYAEMVSLQLRPTDEFYMVANNRNLNRPELLPLFEDISAPNVFFDPEKKVGYASLWYGPPGTVTTTHHDTTNILMVQAKGKKTVRMTHPATPYVLGMAKGYTSAAAPDALWQEVVLEEGDALFIPVGWWHHVTAETAAITLSLTGFRETENKFDWYQPGNV